MVTTLKKAVRLKLDRSVDATQVSTGCVNVLTVAWPQITLPQGGVFRTRLGSGIALPDPRHETTHPAQVLVAALRFAAASPENRQVVAVGVRGEGEDEEAALSRAAMFNELLTRDRDAWVDRAVDKGSLGDVLGFLDYLSEQRGWACTSAKETREQGPAAEEAVLSFQQEFNTTFETSMFEDGVCGRQTLGAIFDLIVKDIELWESTTPKGLGVFADVSELLTLAPETHSLGDGPGVELIVVELSTLHESDTLDEACAASLLEIAGESASPYPVRSSWPGHSVWVRIQMPEAEPTATPVAVRLVAKGFDFDAQVPLSAGFEIRDGVFDIEFEDVPSPSVVSIFLRFSDGHHLAVVTDKEISE